MIKRCSKYSFSFLFQSVQLFTLNTTKPILKCRNRVFLKKYIVKIGYHENSYIKIYIKKYALIYWET